MTTKLGPPPVEGLSDVAWARVERNVFSRMEGTITSAVASREMQKTATSRNKVLWFAVPAAAAAAFALAFFATKSPQGVTPSVQPGSDAPSRIVAGNAPS